MKKLLLSAFLCAIALCSCNKNNEEIKENIKDIEVKELKIEEKLSLIEGDSKELKLTILPEDAKDKTVEWASSNKLVATVDEKGMLKAIKEGAADITVKSSNGITATCNVTVTKKAVPISKIVVSPAELTLIEGESQQISAEVFPSNTTEDISVTLNSTNKDVAIIDDYGFVYALKSGNSDIEVILKNGMKGICKLTVLEPSNLILDIPSIETVKQRAYIQKVMKGDEQIAEICLEYIKTNSIAEQMLVIYPYKNNKADLTSGISLKDGGAIAWDLNSNTCIYTKGNKKPTQINFTEGHISVTEKSEPETKKMTLINSIITDKRSNDVQNYKLVKVGTQYWMAENLRAEHTTDGEEIMNMTTSKEWFKDMRGCRAYYDNDNSNKVPFGSLYNFYAVKNLKLAPIGYHVTANNDWAKLAKYLDANTYDENAIDYETYNESTSIAPLLKSTSGWKNEGNGNNLTGLNIVPAGDRIKSTVGDFFSKGAFTLFWTTDTNRENTAYFRRLFYDMNTVNIYYEYVGNGYSVRCVRD